MDERPGPRHSAPSEAADGPAAHAADAGAEISALAERYRRGEADALWALHERLAPAIGGVLARYQRVGFPPSLTVQDLSQQAWIILADLARRWRPGGSFLAYFLRCFPQEAHRFYRRAMPTRRTRSIEVRTLPHDSLLARLDRRPGGAEAVEEGGAATDALATLPTDQRIAVALRAVEGADFDAIGRVLGVSRATAHRLYRRALAGLANTETRSS